MPSTLLLNLQPGRQDLTALAIHCFGHSHCLLRAPRYNTWVCKTLEPNSTDFENFNRSNTRLRPAKFRSQAFPVPWSETPETKRCSCFENFCASNGNHNSPLPGAPQSSTAAACKKGHPYLDQGYFRLDIWGFGYILSLLSHQNWHFLCCNLTTDILSVVRQLVCLHSPSLKWNMKTGCMKMIFLLVLIIFGSMLS